MTSDLISTIAKIEAAKVRLCIMCAEIGLSPLSKLIETYTSEIVDILQSDAPAVDAIPMQENKHMKMVYIGHPFQGKIENVEDVEQIILKLLKLYPDVTFYSPLHATGFFYFELSYELGMEHCFEALRRCDELWLCEGWENSTGCKLEVAFAIAHNIPIRYIKKNEDTYYLSEVA